jgi:hypothetical protein
MLRSGNHNSQVQSNRSTLVDGASTLSAEVEGMRRGTATIGQLWYEWHHGIDGQLSVVNKNKKFGASWRRGKAKQTYFRRKRVMELVQEIADKRKLTAEAAVIELEAIRKANKWSLHHMAVNFKSVLDVL